MGYLEFLSNPSYSLTYNSFPLRRKRKCVWVGGVCTRGHWVTEGNWLLLPYGFWASNSAHQARAGSAFPSRAVSIRAEV